MKLEALLGDCPQRIQTRCQKPAGPPSKIRVDTKLKQDKVGCETASSNYIMCFESHTKHSQGVGDENIQHDTQTKQRRTCSYARCKLVCFEIGIGSVKKSCCKPCYKKWYS